MMNITVLHLDDDEHLGTVNARRVVEKVSSPETCLSYKGFHSVVDFFNHLNSYSKDAIEAQRFILDHRMPMPVGVDWWPYQGFAANEDNVGVAIAAHLFEHYKVEVANILFYSLSTEREFTSQLDTLDNLFGGRPHHVQKADIPGLMQAIKQWAKN